LQLVECVSTMDAISVVRRVNHCLVLVFARTAHDVAQHLTLLKMIQPQIQSKTVRVIMTAALQNEELIERLTYSGCTEILPDNTPVKALLFKIDRHIKSLPRMQAPEASAKPGSELADTTAPQPGVRLCEEVGQPADIWLLAGGGARKSAGRWSIRLKGPKPEQGHWSTVDGRGVWRWAFDDGSFAAEKGSWVFRGARPELDNGFWVFTGPEPQLCFEADSAVLGAKFDLNAKGSLVIAKDSSAARDFLGAAGARAKAVVPPVVYVDALTLKSDFWLLQKLEPKRVTDRWLVRLIGPGPAAGRWLPQAKVRGVSAEVQLEEQWWQWTPTPGEGQMFMKEAGSWLFYGLQPNIFDGFWSFISSQPELAFYESDKSLGSKISVRETDGALLLARDSAAAVRAITLIKASFDKMELQAERLNAEAAARPKEVRPMVRVLGPSESAPVIPKEVTASVPAEVPRHDLRKVSIPAQPERPEVAEPAEEARFVPKLSALALGVLASELSARRGMSAGEIARRYCGFVSNSLFGLRAELWACAPGSAWSCAGTSDSDAGKYVEAIRSEKSGWFELNGEIVQVVPVLAADEVIGALVIGGDDRVSKITSRYSLAAAQMMFGVLKHYREQPAQNDLAG
jgi:hypothetical protein